MRYDLIYYCLTLDDGGSTGSAAKRGSAPGKDHERLPQGRARRQSRGHAGGMPWRTAGDTREAGVRLAATEDLA